MKYLDHRNYTRLGRCLERGCTCITVSNMWGDWCYRHNVERMDRIKASLKDIAQQMGFKMPDVDFVDDPDIVNPKE